jgi:hypothetical protein
MNGTWMLACALVATGCAAPAFVPSYSQDLPPVEVQGARISEEEPVGPNRQPDWTTQRRFARSRVYVLAPGQWEAELWYRGKYDGRETGDQLRQVELGVGLPHRFQLDYYQNFTDAPGAGIQDIGPQVEGRWAFAEWGKMWANPTAYLEYKWDDTGADKWEAKLLLGDTVAPRWHAASNLIVEQQTSGDRETELGVSTAVSYSVIDGKLGVGAEFTATRVTGKGFRSDPAWEVALGPSIQWRFTERAHLDVVPMIGLNRDTHQVDLFVVLGYDFGGPDSGSFAPTSTKSR